MTTGLAKELKCGRFLYEDTILQTMMNKDHNFNQ